MMKALTFISLFLVGCASLSEPVNPTRNRGGQLIAVNVVVYEDLSELEMVARMNGLRHIRGFASYNDLTCTLHVPAIKHMNEHGKFETWGHELMHCIYGEYHE